MSQQPADGEPDSGERGVQGDETDASCLRRTHGIAKTGFGHGSTSTLPASRAKLDSSRQVVGIERLPWQI